VESGNATLVAAAAAELGRPLTLPDALAVTLAFLDTDPARFHRAAARLHARYCLEVRAVDAEEGLLVLAALRALPSPVAGVAAREALLELFDARGLRPALRVLEEWARRR
jgi:hypothetical protein